MIYNKRKYKGNTDAFLINHIFPHWAICFLFCILFAFAFHGFPIMEIMQNHVWCALDTVFYIKFFLYDYFYLYLCVYCIVSITCHHEKYWIDLLEWEFELTAVACDHLRTKEMWRSGYITFMTVSTLLLIILVAFKDVNIPTEYKC